MFDQPKQDIEIDPAFLAEAARVEKLPQAHVDEPSRPGRVFLAMPMVCPHGHAWESEIMVSRMTGKPVIDWRGPIYLDKYCPECSRPGRRVPITADDMNGTVTAEELQEIGEDALPTLALVLATAMSNPEHYCRTSAQEIAQVTVEHPDRVHGFVVRLQHMGFLKLSETPADNLARFTAEPGDKVRLVTTSQLVTP